MTILDAEEESVPMVREAGICEEGTNMPRAGINRSPAPPPQTALKENATNAQTNKKIIDRIILIN